MENLHARVRLMPLRKFVCDITGEANDNDQEGLKKAVKGWHNKLANGSVPRSFFKKLGKELFVDLSKFEQWLESR